MQASLRQQRVAAPRRAAAFAVAPRRAVTVRASLVGDLTDSVAKAFVTIFSPPRDTLTNYAGTQNSFVGSPLRAQGRRPFKDGYDATARRGTAAGVRSKGAAAKAEVAAPRTASYLEGALGRIISNNFTGDKATEPSRGSTAVEGWKGRIHTRGSSGFHSKTK